MLKISSVVRRTQNLPSPHTHHRLMPTHSPPCAAAPPVAHPHCSPPWLRGCADQTEATTPTLIAAPDRRAKRHGCRAQGRPRCDRGSAGAPRAGSEISMALSHLPSVSCALFLEFAQSWEAWPALNKRRCPHRGRRLQLEIRWRAPPLGTDMTGFDARGRSAPCAGWCSPAATCRRSSTADSFANLRRRSSSSMTVSAGMLASSCYCAWIVLMSYMCVC